jgi:raffinose/stachyose/melibiose transport system substrate-binding protein
MKSKKMYVTFCGVMVLIMLLSACATPTAAPASTNPPAAATNPPVIATNPPAAAQVELTLESWRSEDGTIWQDVIFPAFEAHYPNIKLTFQPTPNAQYVGALTSKFQAGTAGDLIMCTPFDLSLDFYNKGYLVSMNDLPGMEHFNTLARLAWSTDDGKTTYCVPMASVIHGFIYNKDIFDKLGLTAPETVDQFFEVLDVVKNDGTYIPLAFGTGDSWPTNDLGFNNIGPNYWKGEEGRQALVAGTGKLTDQAYIDTWAQLARWAQYMPEGYQSVKYADMQQLFIQGKAAVYPAGSWEVALFSREVKFAMGTFKSPVPEAGGQCYITDFPDQGMGLNAASKHPAEAKLFLEWLTTEEFANLYSNALPGFFSLSDHKVKLDIALAQEFVDWRQICQGTIRNSYQFLSRQEPSLNNEEWRVTQLVINGEMTPEEAGKEVQASLDTWYKPPTK